MYQRKIHELKKLMSTTALQQLLSVLPRNQTQNSCPLVPRVDGGHCLASVGWENESAERELSTTNPEEDLQKLELSFS